MELKERKDIDEKYKFDLSNYCASQEDFYNRIEDLKKEIPKIENYKGKLGNFDLLLEFEKLSEKVSIERDVLYYYAMFLLDVDNANNEYQKMMNSIRSVYVQAETASSFVGEELQKLGEEYLKQVISDERFKNYKHSFEELIRHLPHILDEKESFMVSQMANFIEYNQIFRTIVDTEIVFDKAVDNQGNLHDVSVATYSKLMRDNDRTLRQSAWKSFHKGLAGHKLTLFSCVYNSLKCDDFTNKLAKYDGILEAQFYNYNAPIEVFDKIISQAQKYTYIIKKFREAQAKGLGLEKIEPWDTALMVGKFDKKIDFDSAVNRMRGSFEYLGEKYLNTFDLAIKNKWCDIYPNKNKSSAIYCGCQYGKNPIMHFNWLDEADDMLTFAHEFGHATQQVITDECQPLDTCEMPFIVVEVPSLTSETVMFKYLYNNAEGEQEKLVYLQSFIETFMANVYSGCKLAEFEKFIRTQIQNGEILDVESASNKYLETLKKYTSIDYDDRVKYSWLRDGHIFVDYYNYSYSIAMVVATYFAKGIFEGNTEIRNNFYKFMQAGSSEYPIENLKKCGVDLLDDKVYEKAFGFFEEVVNDYETIINSEKLKEKKKNLLNKN